MLEAGVRLLTRELDSRIKNKEETKDSDASTKVMSISFVTV